MLPDFVLHPALRYPVLPPGRHCCTMEEIEVRFGTQNSERGRLFGHLKNIVEIARHCDVVRLYIGGGFSTGKSYPDDLDIFFVTKWVDRPPGRWSECDRLFDPRQCKARHGADSLNAPEGSSTLESLVLVFAFCKYTNVERGILELEIQ